MSSLDRDLMMPDEPQNKCTCGARSFEDCTCDYDPSGEDKTPKKFAFNLTLHIDEFEAASIEEAEEMLNGYIDRLAQITDEKIYWESVDLTEIDTRLA